MPSKKKTSKSKSASASKKEALQPRAKNNSSVIPFANFTPNFTATNPDMETLMNSQKNQFEKFSVDATEATKQATDSLMKSGNLMMKGYEQMMKTCMTMIQDSTERNNEAMKQLMACKTVHEFTEVQNKIAQQNFDEMMQNATKLSEICIKICSEAFDPINTQLSKAIKKASEQMAA